VNYVVIPPEVRTTICAAAAAAPEVEVCGLLLGDGETIVEAYVSPNRHPTPRFGFVICENLHARLQRLGRARGLRIFGCFHSHPSGSAAPSGQDIQAMRGAGWIWLICTSGGAIAAWRPDGRAIAIRDGTQKRPLVRPHSAGIAPPWEAAR
jgi:proteasome lid subunit RPN8/RPN11